MGPPSGSGSRYVFGADGSYEYSGLSQTFLHSRGVSPFAYQAGRYAVQGDILALEPRVSKMKCLSSCDREMTWERDLSPEIQFRLVSLGTFRATGEPTLVLHSLVLDAGGRLEIDPATREPLVLHRAR